MKNEGVFLVAFIVLAIIVLSMTGRREHISMPSLSKSDDSVEAPTDSLSRISKLETEYSAIDFRVSTMEDTAKKQAKQLSDAQSDVSDATASLAMVT